MKKKLLVLLVLLVCGFTSSAVLAGMRYDNAGCEYYFTNDPNSPGTIYKVYTGNRSNNGDEGQGPCPSAGFRTIAYQDPGESGGYTGFLLNLGDSYQTQIGYILGGISLQHSSTLSSIGFVHDVSNQNSANYFRTDNFTISNSDVLSIFRGVDFDDAHVTFPNLTGLTQQQQDAALAAWVSAKSAQGGISPSSTYFGSTSTVTFTLQLRDASTNNIIATLDVSSIYKNGSSELRYTTSNNTYNRFGYTVSGLSGATSVYLSVAYNATLPQPGSATFTTYGWAADFLSTVFEPENRCGTYQDGCSSLKQAAFNPSSSLTFTLSDLKPLNPNPAKSYTQLDFTSSSEGILNLEVFDILGNTINASEYAVTKGQNAIKYDISTLPPGNYFISLNTGTNRTTLRLNKINK